MFNENLSFEDIQAKLLDPFEESDVKWRVQRSGFKSDNGGEPSPWAIVIPYVSVRAVQQRLDDVFGTFGWENVFKETRTGYLCGITAHFKGRSVTKWDGAEFTSMEALKGGISGAMKRCAVQFGIGRYLYTLKEEFAACRLVYSQREVDKDTENYGKAPKVKGNNVKFRQHNDYVHFAWTPPPLPDVALPNADYNIFITALKDAADLDEAIAAFRNVYKFAKLRNNLAQMRESEISYKAKKVEFASELIEKQTEKAKKISSWLNRSIKDLIIGAENESILTGSFKAIEQELIGRCKEGGIIVSNATYLQHLRSEVKKKLETLKPQGK